MRLIKDRTPNLRKPTYYFLLIIITFLVPNITIAKVVLYSFEKKTDISDVILLGKVIKIKKNFFFKDIAYIKPIKILKGVIKQQELKIKYGNNILLPQEDTTDLTVDEKYVFFLKKEEKLTFKIIGASQGYYHVINDQLICFNGENIILNTFMEKIKDRLR